MPLKPEYDKLIRALDPLFRSLGERRIRQMRSFLSGLLGLWEPHMPADLDAILSLIPKEHWTLQKLAESPDEAKDVRELAAALHAAWKREEP